MPNLTDMLSYLARGNNTATAAKLHIQLAMITGVDPVHQLYEAIPVGTATSAANKIRVVPLNSHTTIWSGVQAHRIYKQGDIVLVALAPTDLMEGSQLNFGVIIGTINNAKFKYIDRHMLPMVPRIPEDKHTDYSRFYDDFNALCGNGNRARNIGFYLPGLEYATSGDYLIRGENTLLRVSDDYVTQKAGGVSIAFGGASESLLLEAATKRESLLGYRESHYIINGEAYSEKINLLGRSSLRAHSPELRGVMTQVGTLVGGSRTSVITPSATLSTIDQRLDGQVHIKTIGGFISDKVVAPDTKIQQYRGLILTDDAIDNVSNSATGLEPFNSVESSNYWSSVRKSFEGFNISGDDWLFDTSADLRSTYNCPYPTDTVDVAEDGSITKVAMCASRIAQCPDGSIILRDAWGSEIRLSNGDIQLSAARKLVLISSDDTLAIVGGALSANCGGLVNIGSSQQLDVVAASVNVAADNITATASTDLILHGDATLQLNTPKDITVCCGSFYGSSAGEATLTAKGSLTMYSKHSAAICSTASQVAVGGSAIELASNRTDIISNVTVAAGSTSHIVGGELTGVSTATGRTTFAGSVVCDKQLFTNDSLIAGASVIANTVMAKVVDPQTGVIRLKSEIKPKAITTTNAVYCDRAVPERAKRIAASKMPSYTLKQLRNVLYKAAKAVTAIVKPVFSRATGVGRSQVSPVSIDNDSGLVYIYPGERFWTSNGLVTLTPNEVESIAVKQSVVSTGAVDLFLHKQEGKNER